MGQRDETARLGALLDEWSSAGIGLRRRLRESIALQVDAMDPGSLPETESRRLADIGFDASLVTRDLPANAVFVPFVEESGAALVAAVQVHEDAIVGSALQAKMTTECLSAAERAIRLAAASAKRTGAGGTVDFVTERRGERIEEVSGRSHSLGVYLSALALFLGRRVLPGTVASAGLTDGRVVGVGKIGAKLAGLVGRADLARFIVASEDADLASREAERLGLTLHVVGVSTPAEAADSALGGSVLGGESLETMIERARRTYGDGWGPRGWVRVEQVAGPLLGVVPTQRPELRVELMTMLAAARRNAGDAAGALDLLDLAAMGLEGGDRWIDKRVLAFHRRQRALTLLDRGLVEQALHEAKGSMRAAEDAGLPGDYAVALGTACLVLLGSARYEEALASLDEAYRLLVERDRRASIRTQAYRVLALARLGRFEEAEAIVEETTRHVGEDRYARRAEAWMRTYLAGALLERGEPERTLRALSAAVIVDEIKREAELGPLARFYSGEAFTVLDEPKLALRMFERVPAESGPRTPFQERRVALTQLRRARLLARVATRSAAEACLAQTLPALARAGEDDLARAREEILRGLGGPATASLAARCVRPWEPLVLGGSR